MKSLARSKPLLNKLLTAGFALAIFGGAHLRTANAQSLTLSFRFDDGTANPAVDYATLATSKTITSANSGQTFTIDIFATVTGTGGTTQTRLGLQSIEYRALISSTNNNAFSTGSGVGQTGTTGGQYSDAGGTNPPYNTPPGATGPWGFFNALTTNGGTGWASSSSGTIGDFGTTTNGTNQVGPTSGVKGFGGASGASSTSALAAESDLTNYETSTATDIAAINVAGANSTTFVLAQFQFKIGNVSAGGGKTTLLPALPLLSNPSTTIATYKITAATPINSSGLLPYNIDSTGVSFVAPAAAGTTISVTPPTDVASVLKGGSLSLSKTLNNTGSTGLNGGDYTFSASGGTNITYGAANPATATTPIAAGGNQAFGFNTQTAPFAGGTPIGIATVTFTAADSGGGKITNSPQTATTSLNVGGAIADNSNQPGVYGPQISAVVGPSGSYTGLESAVVALQGSGGSNAAVVPFASPWLGGDAKIMAGSSSSATARTVSMQWRTRLVGAPTGGQLDETHGGPGSALQAVHSTTGLVSDVVNLTGLELSGQPVPGPTDPFVMDMTYNPGLLPKHGSVEAGLAANKLIYMVSPSPGPDNGTSQYLNTVALNTGNTVTSPLDPNYGAVSSWNAYATAKFGTTNPTAAQLAGDMGAWGVDTGAHEVWAIVDHNSTFAVVPEPATILLAGLGLLGLFGLRRAKKTA
jgi:hypothetical protein